MHQLADEAADEGAKLAYSWETNDQTDSLRDRLAAEERYFVSGSVRIACLDEVENVAGQVNGGDRDRTAGEGDNVQNLASHNAPCEEELASATPSAFAVRVEILRCGNRGVHETRTVAVTLNAAEFDLRFFLTLHSCHHFFRFRFSHPRRVAL